jgi:RNA polymerase sigma factor (sigma-70 family)
MTDSQFMERVLSGGRLMHKSVEWFYHEHFKLVYQAIRKKRLLEEEAIDAYSDAITSFIENIRRHRFQGKSKCSTYFIRIFNNKCIDIVRKKTTNNIDRNTVSLDAVKKENIHNDSEEYEILNIADILVHLSKICRDVLMDWSDGYSMNEIAQRNGLKNANTARSKRYECFKQLKSFIQKSNILLEKQNL